MLTSSKSLACCVCDGNSSFYKNVDGFDLLRCQGCGLIYMKEVATKAINFLEEVTAQENQGKLEYWGYPEYFTKHKRVFDTFFNERYQRIKAHISLSGPWLDIGSGYGLWQSFLKDRNQVCHGLEIEKNAFDFAKRAGVDILHVSIENFTTDQKFAVITMCDVLEHVEGPMEVLRKCYDLLIPGGLLYIQVPNVVGFKIPYGDSLGLPHHLWQFDNRTLQQMIANTGFKSVGFWTGVQGVIKYYQQGGPSLLRQLLWNFARWSKRGNRLQLLVKK